MGSIYLQLCSLYSSTIHVRGSQRQLGVAFDSFYLWYSKAHNVLTNHPHTAVLQESPVIVSLNFILTSVDDPTFVLTCTSTNRPPTYITWTRDRTELSDDSIHSLSQSLINRELATYVNTLTVMGRLPGQYVCHVTTEGWESQQSFTQSASKNITVIGQQCLICLDAVCSEVQFSKCAH